MAVKTYISGLRTALLCILAWIIVLVILPFLILVLCIIIPYKWFVNLIAQWRYPGAVPLAGLDLGSGVTWEAYKSEGRLLSTLGSAFVVVGDVDMVELRKRVQEKLLDVVLPDKEVSRSRKYRFDRLRRSPVKLLWHRYWSAEMEHLDVTSLVKERRTKFTDLETFIGNWLHTGFQDGCPMWEIMVYKDEDQYIGRSIIAVKMAHLLGDGYSIRTVLGALMETETPMFTQEALLQVHHHWIRPIELLVFLSMGPYLLFSFLKTPLFHRDVLLEMDRLSDSFIEFMFVTLESVKTIRRAYDCKFNDVIFVIFGNALRRHLQESVPENKLPKTIPFGCAREVPNRPSEICNHFAQQIFHVPVSNTDRSQALVEMKQETRKVFQYSFYKLLYSISGLPHYVPSFFFPSSDNARPGVTCGVATIPDFENSEYFGPYPVQHGYGLAGLQMKNLAFFGTTATIGNLVNITLLGNRGVFPNQEAMTRFKSFVQEELQLLLETVKIEVQGGSNVRVTDRLLRQAK